MLTRKGEDRCLYATWRTGWYIKCMHVPMIQRTIYFSLPGSGSYSCSSIIINNALFQSEHYFSVDDKLNDYPTDDLAILHLRLPGKLTQVYKKIGMKCTSPCCLC